MALRNIDHVPVDRENADTSILKGAPKHVLKKPTQRHALGTLSKNNIRLNDQHQFKKPLLPASSFQRQPLDSLHTKESAVPIKDEQDDLEDTMMDMTIIDDAFSEQVAIEDIDKNDHDNPQLCAVYVKDIYKYMRSLEQKHHIDPNCLSNQPEITARMRTILINWLVQVHLKFRTLQETLYLTVSIVDRYLAVSEVTKHNLQLVGVTAMYISCKYEESYSCPAKALATMTDNTYTPEEVKTMEREMMNKIDYWFGNPLPLHFLRRNSKAAASTPEIHTMAKFFLELSLLDYAMINFLPSHQAAAALWLSRRLDGEDSWDAKIQHYSGYSEADVKPCARRMAELIMKIDTAKEQAVRAKYSKSAFMKVARDPMLKSQFVTDLAKGV